MTQSAATLLALEDLLDRVLLNNAILEKNKIKIFLDKGELTLPLEDRSLEDIVNSCKLSNYLLGKKCSLSRKIIIGMRSLEVLYENNLTSCELIQEGNIHTLKYSVSNYSQEVTVTFNKNRQTDLEVAKAIRDGYFFEEIKGISLECITPNGIRRDVTNTCYCQEFILQNRMKIPCLHLKLSKSLRDNREMYKKFSILSYI